MKKLATLVLGFGVLVLFSSGVYAGGAGCDSKKGHTKPLSADALHEYKQHHGWIFSEETQDKSSSLQLKKGESVKNPNKDSKVGIEI